MVATLVVTGLAAWAIAIGASASSASRPSPRHGAHLHSLVQTAPSTVLPVGTILRHRFVSTFSLANGALVLRAFMGPTPVIPTSEETAMWASHDISGVVEGIGFARVTLNRSMSTPSTSSQFAGPALTALRDTPALVGLVKDNPYYDCPMATPGGGVGTGGVLHQGRGGKYTSIIPVSQGWSAVVFPLDLSKSDVVFIARSNVCRQLRPSTFEAAYENLSVDWHLETHPNTGTVIVASVPRCARITMAGGGGNEYKGLFEYQVYAELLDRPVNAVCTPATNVDEGSNYANPSTTHGFTGPVLSVGPHMGAVMTPRGPRAQPLY